MSLDNFKNYTQSAALLYFTFQPIFSNLYNFSIRCHLNINRYRY